MTDTETDGEERVRLARDRIQHIQLTAALCMLSWFAVAMLLLWAIR